jgi:hypothetical protein
LKKLILVRLFSALILLLCTSVFAEDFTIDCGHGGSYKELRLIVDLNSKIIKKTYLRHGVPTTWSDYIIYEVTDDEVRAHSDDKYFNEIGVYGFYMVLNRYNLNWFMANGTDWNNPAKDGVIKGGGAECKKLEKAF